MIQGFKKLMRGDIPYPFSVLLQENGVAKTPKE